MEKSLVKLLRYRLRKFLSNLWNALDVHFIESYSQEGEDMVLRAIFSGKQNGFYIDVGAHHPKVFSNTYFFYRKGWKGINIDAMPGSMDRFRQKRKRDINIEAAISEKPNKLTYFIFNEPALNTFSTELAEERNKIEKFRLLSKRQIETVRLDELLMRYMPEGQTTIDFLTIDVEGLDLDVLKSNDWNRFRPTIVLVESLEFSFDKLMENVLVSFLEEKRYRLFSKTVNTLFFADHQFKYSTY